MKIQITELARIESTNSEKNELEEKRSTIKSEQKRTNSSNFEQAPPPE